MSSLQSNNLVAHILLMTETLYQVKEEEILQSTMIGQSISVENHIPDLIFKGNEQCKWLIVVNESQAELLLDDDLVALYKILNALKVSIDDVAILNLDKNSFLNQDIIDSVFNLNTLIFFGINPADLGFKNIASNSIGYHDNKKILASWHLKVIRSSEENKLIFWREMKNLVK